MAEPDTAAGQPSDDLAAEIAYGGGQSENIRVSATAATDDRADPTAACVCGHVKGHHLLPLGAYRAECTWRGCGCPWFVPDVTGIHKDPATGGSA